MISKQELSEIIESLSKRKEWFYSEADFQQELGADIKTYFNNKRKITVIMEYSFVFNPYDHLDILVKFENEPWTAIELKYKTKDCYIKENSDDNESGYYFLKEQGAGNISNYLYWKDVSRLEHFSLCDNKIGNGFAILLTNDSSYKALSRQSKASESCSKRDFVLYCNRTEKITGVLYWKDKVGNYSKKDKYEKPITLIGEYNIEWCDKNYSFLESVVKEKNEFVKTQSNPFLCLVTEIDCNEVREIKFLEYNNLINCTDNDLCKEKIIAFIEMVLESAFDKTVIKNFRENKDYLKGEWCEYVCAYVRTYFADIARVSDYKEIYEILTNTGSYNSIVSMIKDKLNYYMNEVYPVGYKEFINKITTK